jgi:MTH538 TIR-like domain (DUF1863)
LMARCTFFSFDFELDIFRANQVRNASVVGVQKAGYYDYSEYEEVKKGNAAVMRRILRHLDGTTVSVVLLGSRTATRPWVQFEIQESIRRGNGLLGIRIHHLKDHFGRTSFPGPLPAGVALPVYWWDGDLERLGREIEAAAKRGEALRAARVALDRRMFQRPKLTGRPQPSVNLPPSPLADALRGYRFSNPPSPRGLAGFPPAPDWTPPASGLDALTRAYLAGLGALGGPPIRMTAREQAKALLEGLARKKKQWWEP